MFHATFCTFTSFDIETVFSGKHTKLAAKIFARFPQPTTVPAFWPEPVPPNWVLSLKISKILLYFSAQNCIRKLYSMLKTPTFALILL